MAKVSPVVLDFETYWSTTHSLNKMSPIEYVMHPDTELISVSVKELGQEADVVFGEREIRRRMQHIDWRNTLAVAHNMSGFDAMILAWRLGVKPKMWGCTINMARPIYAKTVGLSLAALVKHFGIGVKDSSALISTRGKHLKDFTAEELDAMAAYNAADTTQCFELFKRLLPLTSKQEMLLSDMTIRMLVEPQFQVNRELLRSTLELERKEKRNMLKMFGQKLGVVDGNEFELLGDDEIVEKVSEMLGSSAKFAKLLTELGAEVPMKVSATTGKNIPALAKTDEAFVALQDSDDELVASAARARLGVKSTLLESRIEAFLTAADAAGGKLPIPLKYYGADTTGRWSGWSYNPQNLPRIGAKPKLSDALRMSLRAPKGKKVIVADLSGIELRVNHFLWKVPSSMALYKADPAKADLYKDFAAELYAVDRSEVTKDQRQVGKVAHLGLGFGAGAITFQKVAKLMGGVDIPLHPPEIPAHFVGEDGYLTKEYYAWAAEQPLSSKEIVEKWRRMYAEIAEGWKTCHAALGFIHRGAEVAIDPWGMCVTCEEGIRTPKGMIRYPQLRSERIEDGKFEWVYGSGRNKTRIYAGKVDENIVQHLARCIVADYAVAFAKTEIGRKYPLALCVHDELVYVVDEDEAEEALALLQSIMRTPPDWWPELITWSEGDIADTYGEAK